MYLRTKSARHITVNFYDHFVDVASLLYTLCVVSHRHVLLVAPVTVVIIIANIIYQRISRIKPSGRRQTISRREYYKWIRCLNVFAAFCLILRFRLRRFSSTSGHIAYQRFSCTSATLQRSFVTYREISLSLSLPCLQHHKQYSSVSD